MRSTHEMYAIASRYRGEILNEVSWMERMMDGYIANHFSRGNYLLQGEMHLLFLADNRISFENKRQIFQYITETHDSDWLQSYTSIRFVPHKGKFIKSSLNKDLHYIIEKRNVLAHRVVDTSTSGRNEYEKISFLTYKNIVERIDMDEQSFSELLHLIKNISSFLYQKTQNIFIDQK